MNEIIELFRLYGGKNILMALFVALGMVIIKIPIKKWAEKRPNSVSTIRILTLAPFLIGAAVTAISGCLDKNFSFETDFIDHWLSYSGLGAALYSCIVNFCTKANPIFSDNLKTALYHCFTDSKILKINKRTAANIAETTAKLLRDSIGEEGFAESFYALVSNQLTREESDKLAQAAEKTYYELERKKSIIIEKTKASYEYEHCRQIQQNAVQTKKDKK